MQTQTIFMPLVGVRELQLASSSAATEQVLDIEVVLVLDVSGSMVGAKIDALEAAALNFVDILKADDSDNRVSIGIVPFNGQVNLGPSLLARYNVQHPPLRPQVACVDLPQSVYSAGGMVSRTNPLPATGYVDLYSAPSSMSFSYVSPSSNTPRDTNVWCQDLTENQVLMPTGDVATLNTHIAGLTAIGATSINAGMRWGMSLVDPSARTLFDELRGAGLMGAETAGRPFDDGESNTMKVIVLMTDGEHFAEERLNGAYRSGQSPIYRAADGRYSIYHATQTATTKYWWPHSGEWRSTPYPTVAGATRLDWRQVWDSLRMRYVAWQFYGRAFNSTSVYNSQVDAFRQQTPTATMDAQLRTSCTEARSRNVVVFGVSFEAPAAGRQLIFDCSFSPSHFYDTDVAAVQNDFEAIANQNPVAEADPMIASRLRALLRRLIPEDGSATIEFALQVPVLITILLSGIELGLIQMRHVMLERSLDLTVRDVRLGRLDPVTHDRLRDRILPIQPADAELPGRPPTRDGAAEPAGAHDDPAGCRLRRPRRRQQAAALAVRRSRQQRDGDPARLRPVRSVLPDDRPRGLDLQGIRRRLRAAGDVALRGGAKGMKRRQGPRRLKRLLSAEEGTVTIEFLIALPMLVWAILAAWVFYDAYSTRAINTRASYTLGDALSRETNFISPTYMNSLQELQRFLLQTDQSTSLRVTVVRYDGDTDAHKVVWSQTRGSISPLTNANIASYRPVIPIMPDQGQMIVLESWVDYAPGFEVGLHHFTFHNVTATRPRFAGKLCWNAREDGSLSTATC